MTKCNCSNCCNGRLAKKDPVYGLIYWQSRYEAYSYILDALKEAGIISGSLSDKGIGKVWAWVQEAITECDDMVCCYLPEIKDEKIIKEVLGR